LPLNTTVPAEPTIRARSSPPARLADYFPPPFPNRQAARAALQCRAADLSINRKKSARLRAADFRVGWATFHAVSEQGVDYITALMQGYQDSPPAGVTLPPGNFYNKYFSGTASRSAPLSTSAFEYTTARDDGRTYPRTSRRSDVDREPHLEARKRIGMQVCSF